jgi:hypothetical protein
MSVLNDHVDRMDFFSESRLFATGQNVCLVSAGEMICCLICWWSGLRIALRRVYGFMEGVVEGEVVVGFFGGLYQCYS